MSDVVVPVEAPGGHGRKELAEPRGEVGRALSGPVYKLREEALWQQANVLGKEAKQHPHEEACCNLRIVPSLAQALCELGKLRRGTLGDLACGLVGPEPLRIG